MHQSERNKVRRGGQGEHGTSLPVACRINPVAAATSMPPIEPAKPASPTTEATASFGKTSGNERKHVRGPSLVSRSGQAQEQHLDPDVGHPGRERDRGDHQGADQHRRLSRGIRVHPALMSAEESQPPKTLPMSAAT